MLIFGLLLSFSNSLLASPEKGKASIDAFLKDPTVKNLALSQYQKGANYVDNIKYEREIAKHAIWQQNQNVDPGSLEQVAASKGVQETVGAQIILAEKTRPRFDEIVDLKLIESSQKFTENLEEELIQDGKRYPLNNPT